MKRRIIAAPALGVLALVGLTACGGGSQAKASAPQHTKTTSPGNGSSGTTNKNGVNPNAPENHPPGDIPDNTVYVFYRPPSGHYKVKHPQGWARTQVPGGVRFSGKLNSVTVQVSHPGQAPTTGLVRSAEVPKLKAQKQQFSVTTVKRVSLPAGQAIELDYKARSRPSRVTGKTVLNKAERFSFYKNGTEVTLTLAGPVHADDVDPWRIMSRSFGWTT
jgi:hypothetical protein